jgi:hypothetical protein
VPEIGREGHAHGAECPDDLPSSTKFALELRRDVFLRST